MIFKFIHISQRTVKNSKKAQITPGLFLICIFDNLLRSGLWQLRFGLFFQNELVALVGDLAQA
jgi:hypothetical protein